MFRRRRAPDPQILGLFEESGRNIQRGALLLQELLTGYPERSGLAREILLCEQDGDRIAHDILHRFAQLPTRGAAFDPADVHALTVMLDDIIDYTEACADQLGLYHVEAPMAQSLDIAAVLVSASEHVSNALRGLRSGGDAGPDLVEIHRLENEADRLHRGAVASLFAAGIDPIVVIRWKDIFESLEQAVDACESVANILEGMQLKRRRTA
jgi:uncharacterized protein Yka (UPF0111/DUF47 family)